MGDVSAHGEIKPLSENKEPTCRMYPDVCSPIISLIGAKHSYNYYLSQRQMKRYDEDN